MTLLKKSQSDPAGDNYVEAIRALFDLELPAPEEQLESLDDKMQE
jgi:hypothetical protein